MKQLAYRIWICNTYHFSILWNYGNFARCFIRFLRTTANRRITIKWSILWSEKSYSMLQINIGYPLAPPVSLQLNMGSWKLHGHILSETSCTTRSFLMQPSSSTMPIGVAGCCSTGTWCVFVSQSMVCSSIFAMAELKGQHTSVKFCFCLEKGQPKR